MVPGQSNFKVFPRNATTHVVIYGNGEGGENVTFGFFSRLYILLCILSSNAFGHFGLGKM